MMELNSKSPFLWDLENLVMFNTKDEESPKTLQLVESEIGGIEGYELGSFYSSGTNSDLGYASSSRSSKSASDYSSTDKEIIETNFSLETNECFQQDLKRKSEVAKSKPIITSPTYESSVVSGESLTALELCNRTYFEDSNGKNNSGQKSFPRDSSMKKSKFSSLLEIPRCQVEGCSIDLSSAKNYHRKHRVCESHAKCPRVVINGHERRFCQQCSRFHSLPEFDQNKRSCRRRLSDHNARRRKPKPEVIQFNSMGMASSLFEGRNQLNFGFDQEDSVLRTTPGTWDRTRDSNLTRAKSGFITSINGGTSGLHCTHNGLPNPMIKPVSNHYPSSKVAPPEVYHQGLPAGPTNMDASQNLGALSLLSTSSWGACDPNPSQLGHQHTMNLGGPPVSSEFWISEQQPVSGPVSNTSSFQLFKAPNQSSFYLY